MMATHPAGLPEKFQYLETIVNGAAPLAETDAERFITKSKVLPKFNFSSSAYTTTEMLH